MKTTKWILACVLVVSMTAATIWAQKDAPKDAHQDIVKHSEEIEQLVDIAELDLLTDMIESLLREETVNEIGDLITLIEELSFNRDPVGIVNDVAHDLADLCKAYENACTVVVERPHVPRLSVVPNGKGFARKVADPCTQQGLGVCRIRRRVVDVVGASRC